MRSDLGKLEHQITSNDVGGVALQTKYVMGQIDAFKEVLRYGN